LHFLSCMTTNRGTGYERPSIQIIEVPELWSLPAYSIALPSSSRLSIVLQLVWRDTYSTASVSSIRIGCQPPIPSLKFSFRGKVSYPNISAHPSVLLDNLVFRISSTDMTSSIFRLHHLSFAGCFHPYFTRNDCRCSADNPFQTVFFSVASRMAARNAAPRLVSDCLQPMSLPSSSRARP
jgi:hypothetical protein